MTTPTGTELKPTPTVAPASKPKPTARPDVGVSRKLDAPEELDVLIRARYPIIYVVSWEEERVERCLRQIAESRNKKLFVWTLSSGIVKSGAEPPRGKTNATCDPLAALDSVVDQIEPAIYLFKDFHHFTTNEPYRACGNMPVYRRLRDVALHLRDTYKSIVIVSRCCGSRPSCPKTSRCWTSICRDPTILASCWIASSKTSKTTRK